MTAAIINWQLTLSISRKIGCELHYAGEYKAIKVQYAKVPEGAAKSGERNIFVVESEHYLTRTEFKTEKELIAYVEKTYLSTPQKAKP